MSDYGDATPNPTVSKNPGDDHHWVLLNESIPAWGNGPDTSPKAG